MKTATQPPESIGNASSQEADVLFWSGWRRALGISLLLASIGLFAYVATLTLTASSTSSFTAP
jgi:hypothetical protein